MKKIIFATGNADKMKEIRKILADLDAEVVSMKEAGIQADIVEDGKTFEENAVIKATAISKLTGNGEIVLADDSGLEIDYLNKEPGVYSARYMGENTDYHIKNANLIQRLDGVPMSSVQPVLSALLQLPFQTEEWKLCVEPWKAVLDMRKRVPMDLGMILSFSCRNMAVHLQSCLWKKKIKSATEEKLCRQ